MIINIENIKKLNDSDVSAYQITKDTGLSKASSQVFAVGKKELEI